MQTEDFEFPQIIKDAIKGLDNETRWKIMEYLMSKGTVSYTNLLKELNIQSKGSLTFHLDELSKGAIIERRENFGEKSGEKVFYDISPLGKDIITGLLSALAPVQRNAVVFEKGMLDVAAGTVMGVKEGLVRPEIEYRKSEILRPITVS